MLCNCPPLSISATLCIPKHPFAQTNLLFSTCYMINYYHLLCWQKTTQKGYFSVTDGTTTHIVTRFTANKAACSGSVSSWLSSCVYVRYLAHTLTLILLLESFTNKIQRFREYSHRHGSSLDYSITPFHHFGEKTSFTILKRTSFCHGLMKLLFGRCSNKLLRIRTTNYIQDDYHIRDQTYRCDSCIP